MMSDSGKNPSPDLAGSFRMETNYFIAEKQGLQQFSFRPPESDKLRGDPYLVELLSHIKPYILFTFFSKKIN